MDFGAGGEGIYDEHHHEIRGKLPFSSNSSSSSSSSQYPGLVPLSSNYAPCEPHLQRGWLGNQFQLQQDTCRRYDGPPHPATTSNLELMEVSPRNGNGNEDVDAIQREHMFDKVVTPSDVGKLNRLVIPKQHAEKYFPLDSSTNDKGLLLNFEDRSGKPWRFRYSYWNSSQSYVMTKGWSRFVKEKKLDAGDVVSFQRGVGELGKDRLYIDWRRRPNAADTPSLPHHFPYHRSVPWSRPLFLRPPPVSMTQDDTHFLQPNNINFHLHRTSYGYDNVVNPCPGSVFYLGSAVAPQVQRRGGGGGGGGRGVEPMVFESVPVVHGKAAAKRLRLFGVNMECPISEPEECDILSSTTIPNVTMTASQPSQYHSASAHPPLPFRLYNGTPLPTMPTGFPSKGKQASMSLDLDI